MKKVLVSALVIMLFVAYSFMQRHQAVPQLHQAAPSSPEPTGTSSSSSPSNPTTRAYKDGSYTGSLANAFYGNVQVAVTIMGGKMTAVKFLQSPHDSQNSVSINQQAAPLLKQEALQAQSGHVDIVSGATQTSQAFIQSLTSALSQAQS